MQYFRYKFEEKEDHQNGGVDISGFLAGEIEGQGGGKKEQRKIIPFIEITDDGI